jgi:hypothetical protein
MMKGEESRATAARRVVKIFKGGHFQHLRKVNPYANMVKM